MDSSSRLADGAAENSRGGSGYSRLEDHHHPGKRTKRGQKLGAEMVGGNPRREIWL